MTLFGRIRRSPLAPASVTLWVAAGLGAMSLLLARASLKLAP